MLSIYPVQPLPEPCDDYDVLINGQRIDLNTARVSACPFNRRWPGRQRQRDQSELINFASFATDAAVDIAVRPKRPCAHPDRLAVRPTALGITPTFSADGFIRFRLEKPAYFTLEPFGRQGALHIFADPPAHDDLRPDGPNVLYFGPGEHDAGLITLKDNQTLFIDAGAVLYACVQAVTAKNIRIIGRGILDNSRNCEQILRAIPLGDGSVDVGNAFRRHCIQLDSCENILIDGITIRDSLVYNIRPSACRNLTIRNVKIIGCWRYNSDGIDMHNCENVDIDHCFLRTYDDSICIKGYDFYPHEHNALNARHAQNARNIRVHDCTIWNDWGKCLEIGAETRADEICDILFSDCQIIHVTGPVLDCMNVDYADVHDVTYRNITIHFDDVIDQPLIQRADAERYHDQPRNHDYVPPVIMAHVCFHHEYSAGGTRRGKNRRFIYQNIALTGRQPFHLAFLGFDADHRCEDMLLDGLRHNNQTITALTPDICRLNEFTHNIRLARMIAAETAVFGPKG